MGRPKDKKELMEQAEGNFGKLMVLVDEKWGGDEIAEEDEE